MTQVFNWQADAKPSGTKTFRVRKAQFGDGYAQTSQDGINNASQAWPVTFTNELSVIASIKAFIDVHAGAKAFQWTPPNGLPGLYKCESYIEQQVDGPIWRISCTFNQSFQP